MGNQSSSGQDQNQNNVSNVNLEETLQLSLHLRKQILQSSSFNVQQFPMLATLSADSVKSTRKAPIDLVCVIDRSGSMSGEKIDLVRGSFKYLLNYLSDADRISIILFDDKVDTLVSLSNTTESNKEHILSKLQGVEGRGGTNINLGMERAFKILKGRWTTNPVSSIFLLSDGLDGGAQHNVANSLKKAGISEDVTIHSFGFGQDHDPELMAGIAGLRDGNFYFIKELDTVDEVFVDCLGGLLSSVGQNVQIKIQPTQSDILKGVQIVKAYGDSGMWSEKGGAYSTKISTLVSGAKKNFVLELTIPINTKALQDNQKHIQVAKAEVEVTGLDGKKVTKTAELYITLMNEDDELKPEEDNKEVMKNFYRVKGASLIGEARKLADSGRNEEAVKSLKGFKEELENSFLKNEEFIKNLVKDIERTITNVNPVVYQQYGKIEMLEDCRAQMCEKTNFKSANCYRNSVQSSMIKEVKRMKGK